MEPSPSTETLEPRSPFASSFFLTGATASGKTALGVEIAREIGAEIMSLDSMAVYRRMDVGTAKPTPEERGGVPHRLLDLVDPAEEFSLAEYLKAAETVVSDCESRGKTALFVGGTPLYLKAILNGVFEGPGANPELRERLAREEAENGPGRLHQMLRERDPKSAERLHPNDVKRLIRALEIFELSGKPISELQTQFDAPTLVDPRRVFILTWERATLYDRINRRVDAMLDDGWLDETRALFGISGGSGEAPDSNSEAENASRPGPTASKAVGYRELAAVLRGEMERAEAVEKIKQATRNFAKRQETWFRSLTARGARRVVADGRLTAELRDEIVGEMRRLRENDSRN